MIDVVIGKATNEDPRTPIADIADAFAAYILAEAQVTSWSSAPPGPKDGVAIRLGSVGGRILAEVFASDALADRTSFINALGELTRNGTFGIAALINAALGRQP